MATKLCFVVYSDVLMMWLEFKPLLPKPALQDPGPVISHGDPKRAAWRKGMEDRLTTDILIFICFTML
jgi:hypothetical protein